MATWNSFNSSEIAFSEVQQFWKLKWVWIALGITVLATVWAVVMGWRTQGTISWGTLGVAAAAVGLTFLIVALFRVETVVGKDGVYYRLFPLQWRFRRIAFQEIIDCEPRTYRPIRNFGGWGIRFGRLDGHAARAVNAYGNAGVLFRLRDDRWILLGSQAPQEFAAAVTAHLSSAEK